MSLKLNLTVWSHSDLITISNTCAVHSPTSDYIPVWAPFMTLGRGTGQRVLGRDWDPDTVSGKEAISHWVRHTGEEWSQDRLLKGDELGPPQPGSHWQVSCPDEAQGTFLPVLRRDSKKDFKTSTHACVCCTLGAEPR